MFQLPPTTAAPPSFGMQPQYQQPPNPQQSLLSAMNQQTQQGTQQDQAQQTANAQWMAQQQQQGGGQQPGGGTFSNFGQQQIQQQPGQQPDQQVLQNAGNAQQGLQQQGMARTNLATAIQQMPRPGFNYQNNGLQTRVGPQLRGMPGVVRPPPLMGGSPQQALSQGNRMPSLVR